MGMKKGMGGVKLMMESLLESPRVGLGKGSG